MPLMRELTESIPVGTCEDYTETKTLDTRCDLECRVGALVREVESDFCESNCNLDWDYLHERDKYCGNSNRLLETSGCSRIVIDDRKYSQACCKSPPPAPRAPPAPRPPPAPRLPPKPVASPPPPDPICTKPCIGQWARRRRLLQLTLPQYARLTILAKAQSDLRLR